LPEVARIARSLFPWHSTLGPGVYISNTRFDTLSDFVYPASFAQQGLWFLDRLDPGDTAYKFRLPSSSTASSQRPRLSTG
jgi:hypothetical protein